MDSYLAEESHLDYADSSPLYLPYEGTSSPINPTFGMPQPPPFPFAFRQPVPFLPYHPIPAWPFQLPLYLPLPVPFPIFFPFLTDSFPIKHSFFPSPQVEVHLDPVTDSGRRIRAPSLIGREVLPCERAMKVVAVTETHKVQQKRIRRISSGAKGLVQDVLDQAKEERRIAREKAEAADAKRKAQTLVRNPNVRSRILTPEADLTSRLHSPRAWLIPRLRPFLFREILQSPSFRRPFTIPPLCKNTDYKFLQVIQSAGSPIILQCFRSGIGTPNRDWAQIEEE